MTVAEKLQNKIDDCTIKAIVYLKKHDTDMCHFFLSARNGFIEKRSLLTIDELRSEYGIAEKD